MIKYFESFAGIGGFRLGIERVYNNKYESTQSGQTNGTSGGKRNLNEQKLSVCSTDNTPLCIGYSEIDKYAIQIYEKHFKGQKNYGDIKKINTGTLPDFDLFVGGFPCQTFSIAGKRKGFEDTRGTLFFEIARILKDKRPRYFVLENVKGLLSHDEGNTFKIIIATLDELGYFVEWQVLNSKNHGVPQNRERVFIIGHLGGECKPKVFLVKNSDENNIKENGQINAYCLDSGGNDKRRGTYITHTNRSGITTKRNISAALRSGASHNYQTVMQIRRLTPVECERLQGFPDNWTEEGLDNKGNKVIISDTQRYKVLGNAVTTNVIEFIIKELFDEQKKDTV